MAAFVTLEDYGAALGAEVSVDLVGPVTFALDAACEAIRNHCSQLFDLIEGDVVELDGTGTRSLILPELPVVAVNTVEVTTWSGTTTVTDYSISNFGGILRRTPSTWDSCTSIWPRGYGNITVDYDHGYSAATMPADLKQVAIQAAKNFFENTQRTAGVISEVIGPFQYQLADATTKIELEDFKGALEPYMQRRVPVA